MSATGSLCARQVRISAPVCRLYTRHVVLRDAATSVWQSGLRARAVMNFSGRWWMDGGLVSTYGNRVEGGPLGF